MDKNERNGKKNHLYEQMEESKEKRKKIMLILSLT